MKFGTHAIALALMGATTLAAPATADAQILDKLKKRVENSAEREAANQIDRLVTNAIRCAVDDPECVRNAKTSGEEVVFIDDRGEVIVDEEGEPVTDREEAIARSPAPPAPGEGAWANYDFVPGDEILFYDDYSRDEVGDFPRRLDLVSGGWDIVQWEGGRYLRAIAAGLVTIALPSTLPERFTIEFPMSLRHGNAYLRLSTGPAYQTSRSYEGSVVSVEATRAGIRPLGAGPDVMVPIEHRFERDGVVPLRVMADGDHMKVYIGERRVANAPNAVFPRSDTLYVAVASAAEDRPILIGPIRVAGGGRDLYDRLQRDGRAATQGILFGASSHRIRPESTPTLEEIGTMLREHPGLRLRIEGHTDTDGETDYNQELSDRRAASVKRFLVDRYGIDEGRLEAAGFGESQPVAGNATPEGKQQNRRVELVKLEAAG